LFTLAQAPVQAPDPKPDIICKDYYVDSIPGVPDWHDTMRNAVASKLAKRKTGSAEWIASGRLLRVTGTRLDIQDADQTVDVLERSQRANAPLPQLQAEVGKLRTQVDSLRIRVTALETKAKNP
jgi:hypothetical protein